MRRLVFVRACLNSYLEAPSKRIKITLYLLDDVEALQVVYSIYKDKGVVKIGAEVLRNERVLVLTALRFNLIFYLLAYPFRHYRGYLIHRLCC